MADGAAAVAAPTSGGAGGAGRRLLKGLLSRPEISALVMLLVVLLGF